LKVIIDTNVAVSGLLWAGPPNRILKWARDGVLEIIGCEEIIDEVKRILKYDKFARRISALNSSPAEVLAYYMNLLKFVPSPDSIPGAIRKDPFDNVFLALAFKNSALLIISGDKHLLGLEEYKGIEIVSPSEATTVIERLRG